MKKDNLYFTIGTFGIVLTAILHICFTILVSENSLQIICVILYPVFIAFLIPAIVKIIKEQKSVE